LVTAPERRQRVHTVMVVTSPEGSWARTLTRLEAALGLVVGVADVVADLGLFAAMLANLGHFEVPPGNMIRVARPPK
jgi:hypothetical protein